MGAENAIAEGVRYHDTRVAAPRCEQHACEAISVGFRVETLVGMLGVWIKRRVE